ncbi:DUF2398 family protein [Kineosporia babensis]|uniref:DUF2398 family protein n=1 Tax=Kineosporia babensis TaxID=499548 RepID=A0A9X1NKE9_9ACTN|nr:DUF2398 family protein [Kineosporia babensis]MCD5315788.1 DUF2398 family protein [Kineosporia babensis]
MNQLLDPDLAEAARRLLATCRVSAAEEPVLYRTILQGRRELIEFFRSELGWRLEIHKVPALVRLHKRRDDIPTDRGPYLNRAGRRAHPADPQVLVLVALICEQLWRRPRMTLRELLQSVSQVCAAESASDRLPVFRIVASEGIRKQEAQQNRRNIVDALKLLEYEGEIIVDSDLERAADDEDADLVITADRDSLATKFASLSPTRLELSRRPVHEHAKALSANSLSRNDQADAGNSQPDPLEERRLTAVRRVIDDPAADPLDDPATRSGGLGYLSTDSGRERALNDAAALGLKVTVRQDWWEVSDPSGAATAIDFPLGRRSERQAALSLLHEMVRNGNPERNVTLAQMIEHFTVVRTSLPKWAASYGERLHLLARAAADELVTAGLLRRSDDPDTWIPTPGVFLWRVKLRQSAVDSPVAPEESQ